jgi:UDP-N-acetylmuramate dehydrogenase
MLVETNKSLKNFNTFGIDCKAHYYVSVASTSQLMAMLSDNKYKARFILGGGSNMLLTKDINALVIHLNLKGIKVLSETEDHVHIEAMAGENWHEFVLYCIEKGYGGLENLSLIPGNTGTTPIQNIGAYGVELKDTFESCKAVEIESKTEVQFSKQACQFGYRTSVFKNDLKDKYVITSVVFNLTKTNHKKSTSYGAIQEQLSEKNIKEPTLKNISDAVIAIRKSKLPDPKKIGNSGSFFKNPVIDLERFHDFQLEFPNAPFYKVSQTEFKIPAGWLIEKAGFKGLRFGDAGVHKNQALVLVNYGKANGNEILELAMKIQKKVRKIFGIFLEPEVNII